MAKPVRLVCSLAREMAFSRQACESRPRRLDFLGNVFTSRNKRSASGGGPLVVTRGDVHDGQMHRTSRAMAKTSDARFCRFPTHGYRGHDAPRGRRWFEHFRFHGPLEPWFDKTWRLSDIVPVD
jgi:hypothetical protein